MLPRLSPTTSLVAILLLLANFAFAQTAIFSANVTKGCFPLTVDFKDESTGTTAGTTYAWDFDNGNTSTKQNPQAIFPAPGVYDITLTVSNGGTPSTRTRAGYIVVHDYPAVDFSFDPPSGCAPFKVRFTDKTSAASGQLTNWFWVFGDGGTSTTANPIYTFKAPGSRTVSLRVRNEHGCEKLLSSTLPVTALGPIAKFSVDKPAVCTLPASFAFTNETTGSGLSYQWDFGDGKTSTDQSPGHTYITGGTFNVVMKARDANGCEQSFSTKVNAGSEGGLDIDASLLKVCLGKSVDFKLVETDGDASASQTWKFGDGSSSTDRNPPPHTYTNPGTYTVTLEAKLLNHTCNSIVTKTILVAEPAQPTFSTKVDCNYNLTLTSTSINASRVEWYINGELASSQISFVSPVHSAGNQTVKLIAYDAADCSYELESDVAVPTNPIVAFDPSEQQACEGPSLSGCAPFTIPFTNKTISPDPVTFRWDFGDGGSSTSKDSDHTYISKGLYQVTLTATNSRNCSTTATSFVIVSNTTPVANFDINKSTACAGEEVTVTETSSNADFWCWDFGDGSKGQGKVATHKYAKPGVYSVKLIARNAGCSAVSAPKTITIKDPHITFDLVKSCADPYKIALTDRSSAYDTIHWDFGDGKISTRVDTVKSHRYDHEGIYTVSLIGTNFATGCTTISFLDITVQEVKAKFDVNTLKPCKGSPVVFTDKSNAAVSWEWTVGSFNSNDQNPITTIDAPGEYDAILKVIDSDGCVASDTTTLDVLDMEGSFTYKASSDCDEFSVEFNNDSKGTPEPTVWAWDFGDGITSTDRDPVHNYKHTGKYTVVLSVTNADGTCEFSKDDAIVFTNPAPDFKTSKNEFCPGDVVVVANTSKDAVAYEWDYGDGRRSDFVSPSILYTTTGNYDISLFARDAFGCERKITKPDFVAIEKPTAKFGVASPTGACPPFTAIFSDESQKNIKDWLWDFGDGNTSVLKNPANVYLDPGKFNVKLTVTDDNGCTDSKTVDQFVTVGGPTGNFTSSDNQCTDQIFSFTANVENTATLRWDFGDGTVIEETDNDASHTYASTGTFTPILLLIDAQGCQNVADGSSVLQIKESTEVSMLISPSCIRTGEPFTLKGNNESDDDLSWSWLVDGIVVGNGNDFKPTIDEPGLHIVTGHATNQFNCTSHVSDTVRIQGPIGLIPNVITPNHDGANDAFRITGLENSIWNIDIVNRWGGPVYSKRDYKGDWDGNEQPAGVYYYILRNAVCEDRDYKGFISIVR